MKVIFITLLIVEALLFGTLSLSDTIPSKNRQFFNNKDILDIAEVHLSPSLKEITQFFREMRDLQQKQNSKSS